MDNNSGGLSPAERQRKTAAAIARKKVLEAYGDVGTKTPKQKTTPVNKNVSKADLHKYHSSWQNYYQKYYGEYYAKAAHDYLAAQKLRQERQKADDERLLGEDAATIAAAEQQEEATKESVFKLRRKFTRMSESLKDSRRRRVYIPILVGVGVVLILLFMQFNRLLFAPIAAYVSPGNNESSSITPVDGTVSQPVSADPRLIIPKLNVDVPVDFSSDNSNASMMSSMNNGVTRFAIPGASAMPGEIGNLVITGHSAGDLYSSNPYKFIFSGLERLENGDMIYVNYNSTRYTYSVANKETVSPSDVAALTKTTGKPQLILVTCTPLGTSRYRLLVHADQVSPAIDSTTPAATASSNVTKSESGMPANEPTFFESIWNFLTGKN